MASITAALAQTTTVNHVRTRTYLQPFAVEPTNPTAEQAQTAISYFDGLGRPIQSIGVEQSPTKQDLIQVMEYDAFGRETKKYLPYAIQGLGKYQPEAILRADGLTPGNIPDFYKPNTDHTDDGNSPKVFAETFFENSPLNRVIKQGSVGNAWTGHEMTMAYTTNTASEVKRYDATGLTLTDITQSTINGGFYPAGSLSVGESLDENGNKVREYKNKQGQLLMKRVFNGAELMDTYYIYDDFGQLRAVLQPMFQDTVVVLTLAQKLAQYAFLYVYDTRGRMVEKKIPGIDPVYTVYDQWDMVALSQDGNQRLRNFWGFVRYDFMNRPILTGEKSHTSTRAALQTLVDTKVVNHEEIRSPSTVTNFGKGYSLNQTANTTGVFDPTLSVAVANLLSVTYYDDYNYTGLPTAFVFNNEMALTVNDYITINAGTPDVKSKRLGLVTGTSVALLSTPQVFLNALTFYDDKYRPIQSHRDLYDVGTSGLERMSMKLDFVGKKTQDNTYQSSTATNWTVKKAYTYDHAQRLTQTTHQIIKNIGAGAGGGEQINPVVTLNQLTYNELGQLKEKKLHVNTATDFAEKLVFAYNIKGWLKTNTGFSPNGGGVAIQNYLVNLNYEDGIDHTIAGSKLTYKPQFNGNIRALNVTYPSTTQDGYEFIYDAANRLTNAERASSQLKEFGLTFDLNGNIKTLKRNDAVGVIDNLTYTYTGNQLTRVTDASSLTAGFVSTTPANTTTSIDYMYDKNGSLTQDLNRGIAANGISYNVLNLVNTVAVNGKTLNYSYDAAGMKHKMEVKTGMTSNSKTQYEGIFEYDATPKVTRIATEEGQITLAWTGSTYTPTYQYYLQDHLGNTRVVITQSKTIVQENAYYPFGLQRAIVPTTTVASVAINKYLYNGKEIQPETNWEDYGARQYDGVLGRWMCVDPLSEKGRRWSSYTYAFDNPVRFIDPDGRWPDLPNFEDINRSIKTWAANKINAKLNEMAKSARKTIGDASSALLNSMKYSPYIKIEGNVTVGARAVGGTLNSVGTPALKKGTESDFNARSVTLLSASAELDKSGVNKQYYQVDQSNKSLNTTGLAIAGTLPEGTSVGASVKTEQTFDNNTKKLVNDKYEVSANVSEGPVGIFYSHEVDRNKVQNTTTTTDRVGVFNFGVSLGIILVGEFNISAGFKRTENE